MTSKSSEERLPGVAGRFYPAHREALASMVDNLLSEYRGCKKYPDAQALIVPHAGYLFSGRVAASAFASIPPEKEFGNIVLLGSSHRTRFRGASADRKSFYVTPLGHLKVNTGIVNDLIKNNTCFTFNEEAHHGEHSLEVQLPFIQRHFSRQPELVPVIIGTGSTDIIRDIAEALQPLFIPGNLFIISTDFSHYPSAREAAEKDSETASAIVSGDPEKLTEVISKHKLEGIEGLATSMCGLTAGLTLMYLTMKSGRCRYEHLKYMNSGDSAYGDKDHVVGYHSFIITCDDNSVPPENLNPYIFFNNDEQKTLIEIARKSIESGIAGTYSPCIPENLPDSLRRRSGAFVSLHCRGKLRGCIGRVSSSEPLCNLVADMAYSAAFEDSRFPKLTAGEFTVTEIEISVLSPLIKISGPDEIIIGKHGLYIKKGERSGVMLPQVATEQNWSVTEFLEHTSERKAGIGRDGWKEASIYVFEIFLIRER